jgi:hypothetical protein
MTPNPKDIDGAQPLRLAVAAPQPGNLSADLHSEKDSDFQAADLPADPDNLHELFEAWSRWSRTRRYFAPPPPAGTILGKLSSKPRPFTSPDAACNMDLAALHLAIQGQPRDALDTKVFQAYYGERKPYIKRSADELEISRVHFYRLLKSFCTRVRAIAQDIAGDNRVAREQLGTAASRVVDNTDS